MSRIRLRIFATDRHGDRQTLIQPRWFTLRDARELVRHFRECGFKSIYPVRCK